MITTSLDAAQQDRTHGLDEGSGSRGMPVVGRYRVNLYLAELSQHREVFEYSLGWMKRRQRLESEYPSELQVTRQDYDGPARLTLLRDRGEYHERITAHLNLLDGGGFGVQAMIERSILSQGCAYHAGAEMAPKLVRGIIRNFGAFRDKDVLLTARTCDRDDTPRLAKYLWDPQRMMFVLVVSPVSKGKHLVNADELAVEVAGLAHVYTLADDRVAEAFCGQVGETFECFGGTVCLYKPRLRDTDPGERPPRWTSHFLTCGEKSLFVPQVMEELTGDRRWPPMEREDVGKAS